MTTTTKMIKKMKNSAFAKKALAGTNPAKLKRPAITAMNRSKNDQTNMAFLSRQKQP